MAKPRPLQRSFTRWLSERDARRTFARASAVIATEPDGVSGDHVLLAPTFSAGRNDLQEITRLLAASIGAVTQAARIAA